MMTETIIGSDLSSIFLNNTHVFTDTETWNVRFVSEDLFVFPECTTWLYCYYTKFIMFTNNFNNDNIESRIICEMRKDICRDNLKARKRFMYTSC